MPAALVLVLMLAISFEVASRKLLGQSHAWVVDLGEVSLLFITFFGAAWVLRENAHIRIDTLVRLLPVRAQRAMGLATNLLATGVMLVVALTGAEESLADLLTERMLMGGTVFPTGLAQYRDPGRQCCTGGAVRRQCLAVVQSDANQRRAARGPASGCGQVTWNGT